MLKLLLQVTGWLIAHTPEPLLHLLATALGDLMLAFAGRRRRLIFSNLHHAFPERSAVWHRRMARSSSRRIFETGLLSLASPFLSEARLRRIVQLTPAVEECFRQRHLTPHPLIVATPHIAYWESLTWLGLFLPVPLGEFGVIFRPLDNATADAWVKTTRERHGMRLLSRKEGLTEAFRVLRRRATVGLLFDQNAGLQGALTLLLGRVCSTSELAGLLVEKSSARLVAFYPRRLRFWRVQFELEDIPGEGTSAGATLGLNRWLETKLAGDEHLCASWLWSHDRWRHQDMPEKRFHLESKRDLLPSDLAARGAGALPRKTRLFIRLPNWLGDVVMVLPLLRTLRISRPDAEITLVAKSAFLPLLARCAIADHLHALPPRGWGYFFHFWKLRRSHLDVYLLITHSLRGDLEAWLTGCRQRFGLVKPGRPRPLLSHRYELPAHVDESRHHQFELTENLFRHFGLYREIDFHPFLPSVSGPKNQSADLIGFIPGSENNPGKRWPIAHWRALLTAQLQAHPATTVLLFGTAADRAITDQIAQGFDSALVENLAGRTDLPAYMENLQRCLLLVTNDTGGMHLANALGVPLIALFGPTNPVRTGPIFIAPRVLLQPPHCPPTGGVSLTELSPETVFMAVQTLRAELTSPPSLAVEITVPSL